VYLPRFSHALPRFSHALPRFSHALPRFSHALPQFSHALPPPPSIPFVEARDEHWDDKQVYLLEVRDDDKTYRHGLGKSSELEEGGTVLRHISDVIQLDFMSILAFPPLVDSGWRC
jgi:hypothetical protein